MSNRQLSEAFFASPITDRLGIQDLIELSDKPDIWFSKNGKLIGAEVTKCYPDEVPLSGQFQQLRARLGDVCHIYKKKLETAGESGLWATVYFTDAAFQFDPIDNRPQFKSVAIEEIKRKREQFELKQHLGQRGIMDIYYERMKTGYYDCKYIDSVSVHYLPSSKLLEVSPIFMGWYTTIPLANIEACITEKENKLAQYKTMSKNIDIDEYWLFISIPPGAGCSLDSFEMPPISSSYERIYITDFAQVLQLI